ncbi:MAG: LTA synthase family protein [Mucinivorans sp.]
MIKKILHSPLVSLLLRLALAYATLGSLRIIFYLTNTDTLGTVQWSEIPELLSGSLLFDTANICYTYGLFIVLSLLPLSVKTVQKKWYQWTSATLYALATVAVVVSNLGDSVYFHFAKKRFTSDEILYATENNNNGTIMWQAAKDNWWLMLVAVVIIALVMWCYKLTVQHYGRIKHPALYYTVKGVIFILGAFLLVVGIRGGVSRAIRPITLSNAAQYATSPAKASIVLSNPFCFLRTIENKRTAYEHYFTDTEPYFSPLHTPVRQKDSTIKSQKGKNIVIFIMESFSAEHSKLLNPTIYEDGESYMPFLDSLMTEGYYFTRAYANGRKSIDAMPSVLASIPSFKSPFATLPAALSPMDGIGTLLKEHGYSTWFFNGSERNSMGYVAYARLAGIDNFRTREDYESARGNGDFDGYWGIWDEPFLNYFAQELNHTQQPFLATLFTLSSHHPFVVPEALEESLPRGRTKIHRTVAYTDRAFRHFFDFARRQTWFNNTLFVFVADHVSSEIFASVTSTPTGNSHIVYFMYTPDGSLKGKSNQITQQIDITPTLLGLMEYDKPYMAFGQNSFAPRYTPFAINYSGQSFQWIEQQKAYFFDEKQLTNVYDLSSDSLEQHNIVSEGDSLVTNKIKAFIQSYYEHLERGDFSVRER